MAVNLKELPEKLRTAAGERMRALVGAPMVRKSIDRAKTIVGRRAGELGHRIAPAWQAAAKGPERSNAFIAVLGGDNPDGMCADEHGNLWIAMWGGGQVRCYSPAGEFVAVVEVDAPNTTSVAFVGATLDALLITTASEQLSDEQRACHPDSGRLFIAQVGVSGAPVQHWAGTDRTSAAHGTTTSTNGR